MIKQKINQCYQRSLSALSAKKHLILLVSVIGILLDVFVFKFTSDLVILILTGLWIGAVVGWRLEGRFSILGALIFLTMCPSLLIFKQEAVAEKAAIWAYMFLVVGVVQQLIEFKKKPKDLKDFDQFLKFLLQVSQKAKKKFKEKGIIGILKLLGSCFEKQWANAPNKFQAWMNNPPKNWLIKIIKITIAILGKFLIKFWFYLSLIFLSTVIFFNFIKEIKFYHWFFENQYWQQIWQRMGIWLIMFWMGELALLFWIIKKWKSVKLRKVFIVLLLLILWRGNAIIFNKIRGQFADKPYILRISPAIASKYQIVKIYGRNFRDLPFEGRVLIDGKEQAIKSIGNERSWGNQEIIMVVDPEHSQAGQLEVWVNWDDKWVKSNGVDFTYYNSKTATPEEERKFWESLKNKR